MNSQKQKQKALTREYRRQPKTLGAYCIRNTISGKCFVGVSRDVTARLNRHRFALKSNTELVIQELQKDWNALGAEAFEFTVLDTIEPRDEPDFDPSEDLEVLEQLWLDQLKSFEPDGYNKLQG